MKLREKSFGVDFERDSVEGKHRKLLAKDEGK